MLPRWNPLACFLACLDFLSRSLGNLAHINFPSSEPFYLGAVESLEVVGLREIKTLEMRRCQAQTESLGNAKTAFNSRKTDFTCFDWLSSKTNDQT